MKRFLTIAIILLSIFNLSFSQTLGDYDPDPSYNNCLNLSYNMRIRTVDSSVKGEVSKLQYFLQSKGYLNSEPTGYFGNMTFGAVKSYQASKNLNATGYVGALTRGAIQVDSCSSIPPIACTMEARLCSDGSMMPRDSDCTWREDRCNRSNPSICSMDIEYTYPFTLINSSNYRKQCTCPEGTYQKYLSSNDNGLAREIVRFKCVYQTNLQYYNIDVNIFSTNLNKYLSKNSNDYYDATGVDGNVSFNINTNNNSVCSVMTKSSSSFSYQDTYSLVSNSKNFNQIYNKNGIGIDYYKVSCGDDINFKKVVKEFIVETKMETNNQCPLNIDFYKSEYPNCYCPVSSVNYSDITKRQCIYHQADMKKPVIYLYPEETKNVLVKLNYDGELVFTYPEYKNGWEVIANPDGRIINKLDKKEYSYLFWEGSNREEIKYDLSKGFIVKKENFITFMQEKLSKLGLTPKEYNEFIVYWYPQVMNNKYTLVHLATKEEYDDKAKLNINPKPDSLLRVFVVFKNIENIDNVKITEQEIKPFVRKGFSVIEWGGTEIK